MVCHDKGPESEIILLLVLHKCDGSIGHNMNTYHRPSHLDTNVFLTHTTLIFMCFSGHC